MPSRRISPFQQIHTPSTLHHTSITYPIYTCIGAERPLTALPIYPLNDSSTVKGGYASISQTRHRCQTSRFQLGSSNPQIQRHFHFVNPPFCSIVKGHTYGTLIRDRYTPRHANIQLEYRLCVITPKHPSIHPTTTSTNTLPFNQYHSDIFSLTQSIPT